MDIKALAEIIMERDDISYDEAFALVQDTQDEIMGIIEEEESPSLAYQMAEDVLRDNLNLEPDYLMYVIAEI